MRRSPGWGMDETSAVAVRRGQALLELGRAKEAEGHFRTALAASPGDPELHTLLAQSLLRQQRYGEARDASRAALTADPEDVTAHSALAGALAGLKLLPEALEVVRRALELAPLSAGLHLQEGYVLLAQDRPAEALESVGRARALAPEDADCAALRAAALYELHRLDEADAAVAEALRLDPQHVDAHRIQGLLALRRGGGESAIRAHRTALRLDPTDSGAREGLSVALKSRNPLYGALLRYGSWLSSLPTGTRWLVLLVPFVLTRLLRPFDGQTWAEVLIVVVVALVVLSWALEPLMNCVLLLGRERHLLSRPARLATYGFLGFASASIATVVVGMTAGPPRLMTLALGLGLWAMATGSAHTVRADLRKVPAIGAAVAALLAVVAFAATVAGAESAGLVVSLVLLGGIAATWFTVFA
ncbi:tetratricopeptide repeat protein [Saccharothrix coeruleofusca]|uniref:tetratricopeptide repeat protein n=1 Tax=Saccharothrix coeruleofusca TaxID=33919 RepID=UPI00355760F7